MKTRDLIWQFLLALVVVIPLGCKETDKPTEGGFRGYQDYAFRYVIMPKRLKMGTMLEERRDPSIMRLRIDIDGPVLSDWEGHSSGLQELQEFRQRVGDTYRYQYYEVRPYPVQVVARGITSLSVEAVEDYNENYLAGVSLAPIIEVSYWSWDASFYSNSFNGVLHHEAHTRLLSEGLMDTRLPVPKQIMLDFLEAPSLPRVKLRFVVTFDNDSQLELTKEVEIRRVS